MQITNAMDEPTKQVNTKEIIPLFDELNKKDMEHLIECMKPS